MMLGFHGTELVFGPLSPFCLPVSIRSPKKKKQFGTVTLGEHYKRIAVEGNDYDPYTTLFAGKKKPTGMVASLLGNGVVAEEKEEEKEKEPVAK